LSFSLVPRRIDRAELLDEPDAPPPDVERSLRDLRRFNAWLGGIRAYRALIRRHASQARSVLDIGTGTSDLVASLRGRSPGPLIGLDFKLAHLSRGRAYHDGVLRLAGDGFRLPFRDGSVDVVTSGHLFHHFTPEQNVAMLDECLRVARVAVIVNDTRRDVVPWAFTSLLGALRLVGRITAHDAPVSVLRGYSIGEARSIAAATAAGRWRVERMLPYRIGVILWKST
jgi:hypothetical protein